MFLLRFLIYDADHFVHMLGVMDGPTATGKKSLGASLDESVAVSEVTSSRAGEMLM